MLAREQAIQFVMAHEQALEEGKPPLDPPDSLLSRLGSGDRAAFFNSSASNVNASAPRGYRYPIPIDQASRLFRVIESWRKLAAAEWELCTRRSR